MALVWVIHGWEHFSDRNLGKVPCTECGSCVSVSWSLRVVVKVKMNELAWK